MVFKGCTRCRGDLYIEDEMGIRDLVCLQCGCRQPCVAAPVAAESRQEKANLLRRLNSQRATIAA